MALGDSLSCSQKHTTVFPSLNSHPSNFFLYESRPVYLWVYQVISFLQIFLPFPTYISVTSHTIHQ